MLVGACQSGDASIVWCVLYVKTSHAARVTTN